MTYDQWKTTDPRDYLPEEPELPTELEIAYERCRELEDDIADLSATSKARIAELTASLEEALEYFKARYDVKDGDNGQQLPNEEMRLGTMIDEALYGIRF